jgi:GTP-binding protein HflX
LEDVIEADVLLHVRDVSHGETEAQAGDVMRVLRDLGINPNDEGVVIEVWNKADLLSPEDRQRLAALIERKAADARPALVSSVTGEGLETLLARIEQRVAADRLSFAVTLDAADGGGLNWLYEHTEVLQRRSDAEGHVVMAVRIAPEKEPRLLKRYPRAHRLN